jgi:hypothetical protein
MLVWRRWLNCTVTRPLCAGVSGGVGGGVDGGKGGGAAAAATVSVAFASVAFTFAFFIGHLYRYIYTQAHPYRSFIQMFWGGSGGEGGGGGMSATSLLDFVVSDSATLVATRRVWPKTDREVSGRKGGGGKGEGAAAAGPQTCTLASSPPPADPTDLGILAGRILALI